MDTVTAINEPKDHTKCVVEFQAFKNNSGRFIVKELVIYDITTHVVNYFVFKPPFRICKLNHKAFKTNNWVTSNYHYISWDEGFIEYKELSNILRHYCRQYQEIYTSGYEKSKFIGKYTKGPIFNVELPHAFLPNNYDGLCIGIRCPQHKLNHCALSRAYRVGAFINSGGEEAYKLQMQQCTTHSLF